MVNTLVYDIEIINAIPPKDLTDRIAGINYCKGWRDFAGMGIAVIGYQWNNEKPQHCLHIREFFNVVCRLDGRQKNAIVGFNSTSFDDNVLRGTDSDLEITTHYDLYKEIVKAVTGSYNCRPRGYSLDNIAKANGMAKNGDGAMAPVLWQQGKHQEVIDYCLNDVIVTKKLLNLGLAGKLIDPNNGSLIQLPMPTIPD